jgi:hypothetical protein
MACPKCGCKTTYQFDTDEDPDEEWERCAACRHVFHIEDHADEEDDDLDDRSTTPQVAYSRRGR